MGARLKIVGLTYIHTTSGDERNASLRVGRLVLGEVLELVVLVFVVADVAIAIEISILLIAKKGKERYIPLAGKEEAVGALICDALR